MEDGTVGTVTAVREITPEQNEGEGLTRAQQLARERIESGRTIDEINQENLEAVRERARERNEAFQNRNTITESIVTEQIDNQNPDTTFVKPVIQKEE